MSQTMCLFKCAHVLRTCKHTTQKIEEENEFNIHHEMKQIEIILHKNDNSTN